MTLRASSVLFEEYSRNKSLSYTEERHIEDYQAVYEPEEAGAAHSKALIPVIFPELKKSFKKIRHSMQKVP